MAWSRCSKWHQEHALGYILPPLLLSISFSSAVAKMTPAAPGQHRSSSALVLSLVEKKCLFLVTHHKPGVDSHWALMSPTLMPSNHCIQGREYPEQPRLAPGSSLSCGGGCGLKVAEGSSAKEKRSQNIKKWLLAFRNRWSLLESKNLKQYQL